MTKQFTVADLEGYLDETLPAATMAAIEAALRANAALVARLTTLIARRDAGIHSVGDCWRRGRLSCPSRQQLGSHLLRALPDEVAHFITFHLQTVGCRYCAANLADLKAQQAESPVDRDGRRRRYFQSSAGYLKRHTGNP
ncbi:MAG: hypothetical protein A2W31_03395 [Planctomycetes bacterium RBG_16_64_10]|nr:MAG: hypothetical protein A2W31_03395 [Planctomycetes bacterium RBG_16_64_10]